MKFKETLLNNPCPFPNIKKALLKKHQCGCSRSKFQDKAGELLLHAAGSPAVELLTCGGSQAINMGSRGDTQRTHREHRQLNKSLGYK